MNYANYDDVANQLRAAGLILGTVKRTHGGVLHGELYVGSTKSVRCDVDGERKRQTGAYWLHELRLDDGIWLAGSYWVDHGNTSFKLDLNKECAKCGATIPLKASSCPACGGKKARSREIPPEQLAAHKARMEEARRQAEAERKQEIERASRWATAVWRACPEAQPGEHDYLKRKQLSAAGGVRIFESTEGIALQGDEEEVADAYKYLATFQGALVIPACDDNARVYGLQFILSRENERHREYIRRAGRDKVYWPSGMSVEGNYWLLGSSPGSVCLVAEGYATGMSLHDATGLPVAVAFAANNLLPVATALRKRYKRANLLICADDDQVQRCNGCGKYTPIDAPVCAHCGADHGKNNPGVESARHAALQVKNAAWVKPAFSDAVPRDKKGDTDYNDLRVREGLQAVRSQIEQALTFLAWRIPSGPASVSARDAQNTGGRGERNSAKSVMSMDDAIGRFIPLDDGTGKHLFDTWTNKVALKEQMLAILPAGVRWDDVKRAPEWIDRGAYYIDQVGFDPGGDDKNVKLNTWRGWPMEPKQGRCDCLLDLLAYLCSGEQNQQELVQWILRWMAYPLQNPGAKMHSAIILHGPQGTGKSTIFQTLAKIYGDYATVLNQRGLEDKFNSDWSDSKLFILAEEVVTRAEMWHIKNELKELVTGEWIRINPKNIAAYRQRNHVNVAYLSNENQPLPIENDDRRHCVVYTPPALSEEFYDEVFQELENGGVQAFYHHLVTLDLGDFHPKKKPPMTEAKQALINLSLPSEQRFIQEWTNGDTDWPLCPCLSSDLYAAYLRWCRVNGETRPRASNHFLSMVGKLPGWESKKCRVYEDLKFMGSTVPKTVVIPSETLLQAVGKAMDPEKKQTEWLTECLFEFANAGKQEDKWTA